MAEIDWPAELPAYPQLQAFTVKAASNVLRTPMDSGLARARKRFSTPTSRLAVSWSMNGTQAALFKSWLVHKAASGGAWFNITLRLDEGERQVEARFVADASYQLQTRGNADGAERWRISSEIEIKDLPPYSSDVVDILIDIGQDQLFAIQAALDGGVFQPAIDAWDAHF